MRSTKLAGLALALTIYPALAMVQGDLPKIFTIDPQQPPTGDQATSGEDPGKTKPAWLNAVRMKTDHRRTVSQAQDGNGRVDAGNTRDRKYALKSANPAGRWVHATGAAPDENHIGPLADQYAHAQTLKCANRIAVSGFSLSKIGDRLAPNIYCGASKKHIASKLGDSHFGKLEDQYADTRLYACPPGKFVQIFAFQKRGNRLAPRIKCEGSRNWVQATANVDDPSSFGPLESRYADTQVLKCPGTKRVSKFRFVRHGNRLAPAIYCE